MQKIINGVFLLQPDYDMREQVGIPVLLVRSWNTWGKEE